ncbi:hypothetical protein Cgig2_032400 [Carnegiea gigantea]|uniref:Uncharacterized protein n=1 Tax=Carnegiea gigantea TaxID=171969 RepID=A0A9Q1GNP7_9CARY|nr:hypothetical protein Cgig2_032400 [Carnegiea gigantea]
MGKYVEEKRQKAMREKGSKKPKVFRHHIKMMRELCKANRGKEQCSWAEAVWRFLFESLEEMQKKLCTGEVFDVQMNGFTQLIQPVGNKVDHGGWYGAFKLLADIKECQVILVLLPRDEEKVEPIMGAFLGTNDCRYYVMDAEGAVCGEGGNGCTLEDDLDVECDDEENSPHRSVLSEPDQRSVGHEGEANASGHSSPYPSDTAEVGATAEVAAAEENTVHCIAGMTVGKNDGAVIMEVAATTPGTTVGAERVSGQLSRSSTSNLVKRMKIKLRAQTGSGAWLTV